MWQPSAASSRASSSSVSPASRRERPSQATASRRPGASPSAARGWRPSVMSESNCAWPAEKPSGSSARVKHGAPSRTSSGPACSRSPRGCGGELVALRDPHPPAVDVHARAQLAPRRGERHVAARHPARAQLAERDATGAHEEAADERLLDAARGAPRLEPLRPAQHRDVQLRACAPGRSRRRRSWRRRRRAARGRARGDRRAGPRGGVRRPWLKGSASRLKAREHAVTPAPSCLPPDGQGDCG